MSAPKRLRMRPYARLMTMLGEQLIKNERIALMELIKNAYDADSPWAVVSFDGFGENFQVTDQSRIVIEDAGHGMTQETIEKHWLNPATPDKLRRKAKNLRTHAGRVMQGEKGIGRFAILKLGRTVKIITRPTGSAEEHVIEFDFSRFDDDFLEENGRSKDLFLEDLEVTLHSKKAQTIREKSLQVGVAKVKRPAHGTRVEISNIKGGWTEGKLRDVSRDVSRLEPIFTSGANAGRPRIKTSFDVWICRDGTPQPYQEEQRENFHSLLTERSVLRISDGSFDPNKLRFKFLLNDAPHVLTLKDPEVIALTTFRRRFGKTGEILRNRNIECGPFRFGFYIFDLSKQAPPRYQLDNEDKQILRDHRVYLYRDGIRVYPYGDPQDDWLQIDALRGTESASYFLSNDQLVGYVHITQKDNPKLRDKTNREGLIEEGDATADFIALLQTFLRYIRAKPYTRYRIGLEKKSAQEVFRTEQVQLEFEALKETVQGNRKAQEVIARAERAYKTERTYLVRRAELTEDLAGVGLSVEAASHDIMSFMGKALASIDSLLHQIVNGPVEEDELREELQSLRGMLSFVESQLKDVQLLFASSKQRRRSIRVKDVLDKVVRIYQGPLKGEGIEVRTDVSGSPLMAKTTDAVLLQLFLNLFDNATYWLSQTASRQKRIEVHLDGNRGHLIFADNGPGVAKDDAPYIFEPFYSGKGEEGRGLGLYIARQLLERSEYSIELATLKAERILPGANFVVSFVGTEES